MASDMWHSTAAVMGAILLQAGCVLISVVMIRTKVFKTIGYLGVLTHGLDLAHLLVPPAGFILLAIAGPLYLIWFPLVGFKLYKLTEQPALAPRIR